MTRWDLIKGVAFIFLQFCIAAGLITFAIWCAVAKWWGM